MRLKQTISIAAGLLCTLNSVAQFKYNITATPDSAIVRLNGMEVCTTPCSPLFRWKKDAQDGMVLLEVSSPGYNSWADTIRKKPTELKLSSNVDLDLDYPELELDSTAPIVAFDKLVMDPPDQKKIGRYKDKQGETETMGWVGSKISERKFARIFYGTTIASGVPTPFDSKARVFSEQKRNANKLPRFIIGGTITEMFTNLAYDKSAGKGVDPVLGSSRTNIEWQVMDMATGKVVLKRNKPAEVRIRCRPYDTSTIPIRVFELSLLGLYEDEDMLRLLKETENASFTPRVIAADDTLIMQSVLLPSFENSAELIQYGSEACVTVLTDGGHGSGVVISEDGMILSAEHVISGANKIEVEFANGLKMDATIVRTDPVNDVVLLQISGKGHKALPLGVNSSPKLGEEVLTIGTPAEVELGQSVAKGIVSGKRKVDNDVYIQTDMAVSPGNSGGPLINMQGEVVGIIQRKVIAEGVEGIGFALPIDVAVEVLGLRPTK